MREILFRGKRKDNGEWIEGGIYVEGKKCFVTRSIRYIPDTRDWDTVEYYEKHPVYKMDTVEVVPETVGQFVETKDKNKKRIFEGDILRKTNEGRHPEIFTACIYSDFPEKEEVYYSPFEHFTESCEYEIIGNKYDNPELLEVK